MRPLPCAIAWILFSATLVAAQTVPAEKTDYKFSFGSTPVAGAIPIDADVVFTKEKGFGFEPTTHLPTPGQVMRPVVPPTLLTREHAIASDKPFIFSVAVPPGNYRVTLTLGDSEATSATTVKAEARRLMLEHISLDRATSATRTFLVNVRRPEIPEHTMLTPRFVTPGETGPAPTVVPASVVKLDPREPGSFTWDDKLSLQFLDAHPAIESLEIHKVDDAITVYLCSDSTVVDQPIEPYGSWGQMLPRWFNDKVCIANYAESGQTLKAFMIEKRWDKVMSLVKKGDYVFMQFGNNDSQTNGHNGMWPADDHSEDWNVVHSPADTDYQSILRDWSAQVKAKGATPIIVSPYTRQSGGVPQAGGGLRGYPEAAEKAAKESNTAFLNLTAISTDVLTALTPANASPAYVDGQHTTSYGAYLNARSVAYGIRQLKLDLAEYLLPEAAAFDPKKPLPLRADFSVPLEAAPGRGGAPRGRGTPPAGTTSTSPAPGRSN